MKKNDWIFLVSLAAYALLFWKQDAGVNFLLMNIVLITGQLLMNRTLMRSWSWCTIAGAALLTSFCVMYYSSALSILANVFSVVLLASWPLRKENSLAAAFALGMLNYFTSPVFLLINSARRFGGKREESQPRRFDFRRLLLLVLVAVIVIFFLVLYRESSVLFNSLTKNIDLSFISVPWLVFMVFGTLLLYGFYRQHSLTALESWERTRPINLQAGESKSFLDQFMSMGSEYFSGVILLALLNVLLLVVNGLDIAFIAGGAQFLPADVTYSQYVHQGIEALIVSIIFATAIILFYFRNYHPESKSYRNMRALAMLWVAQNVFMIGVTIWRNHEYIFVYGLTYKRIGVDVYLLLAMTGLILLAVKVWFQKGFFFLVRTFSWVMYGMLVLATPMSWDEMIFAYNSSLKRSLDMDYMNSLSWIILDEQHDYARTHPEMDGAVQSGLDRKTFGFISDYRYVRDNKKFPSWIWQGRTYDRLTFYNDRLTHRSEVDASNLDLQSLYYIRGYAHVKWINLQNNQIASLEEIGNYTQLEVLNLMNNKELTSLHGLEKCTQLRALDIRGTGITHLYTLIHLKHLRWLYVDDISDEMRRQLGLINPELTISTSRYDEYNW